MINIYNYICEKLKLTKDIQTVTPEPDDPSTWGVGNILAGSFGYDMTLPHFYKIISRTAKQFTVQRMKGKIVSGHRNGQWTEVPDEDASLMKDTFKARINKWGSVRVDNIHVSLWDGKPLHGDDLN